MRNKHSGPGEAHRAAGISRALNSADSDQQCAVGAMLSNFQGWALRGLAVFFASLHGSCSPVRKPELDC